MTRTSISILALTGFVAGLGTLYAASGHASDPSNAPTLAAGGVQNGGTAVGTVKFLVDPPEPERLRVDQNADVCGLRKFSKDFIVSKETKGLKNVVLTVVGAKAPAGVTLSPPALAQNECEYDPHVQVAMVGQTLPITNRDDVLHNIHAYDAKQATLFNLAQPIQNQTTPVELKQAGVVRVKCDVHSWMQAYVVVSDHPYTAVTDENGQYRIEGIPPGTYKIRAWHEGLGQLEKEITIAAGGEASVNFDVGA